MQAGRPQDHAEVMNGGCQPRAGAAGVSRLAPGQTGVLRQAARAGRRGCLRNKIELCGAGGLLYIAISGVGSAEGKTPALPQRGLCSKGQGGKLTTLHAGRVIGSEAKR